MSISTAPQNCWAWERESSSVNSRTRILTYREVVEQVRMERALDLIRELSHTVTSIALLLGYSEIASFTRAFQRWTGRAPSQYRAPERV